MACHCSSRPVLGLALVKAINAHVYKGQIVLDEPVDLPDGVAVKVLLPDEDDLTPEERDELEAALDDSVAEFSRGEFEDARVFASKLAARS
jgi:hypothetical protein